MKEQERIELIEFLKASIKVFAWTLYKMPRIDSSFIKHELNVMPDSYNKIVGKKLATKHVNMVIEEVKKVNEANTITKVRYPR